MIGRKDRRLFSPGRVFSQRSQNVPDRFCRIPPDRRCPDNQGVRTFRDLYGLLRIHFIEAAYFYCYACIRPVVLMKAAGVLNAGPDAGCQLPYMAARSKDKGGFHCLCRSAFRSFAARLRTAFKSFTTRFRTAFRSIRFRQINIVQAVQNRICDQSFRRAYHADPVIFRKPDGILHGTLSLFAKNITVIFPGGLQIGIRIRIAAEDIFVSNIAAEGIGSKQDFIVNIHDIQRGCRVFFLDRMEIQLPAAERDRSFQPYDDPAERFLCEPFQACESIHISDQRDLRILLQ